MSYILDALKKAEHERAIGQVPGIGSEHEPSARNGAGRWLWVLLAVLFVNAVLLVTLLWPNAAPTPPSGVVSGTVAPARSASRQVPAAPVPLPAPSNLSASLAATSPAFTSPETPVVSRPLSPMVPLRPLPPLPEPVRTDVVETPDGRSRYTDNARQDQSPVVVPVKPAGVNDNLPVWPQISGQLLSELNGSLHLDVHVYSKNPDERFVLINMRKYHPGEKLQEGPVVDDITPDSVILSYHGQRFRMQSQ